MPHRWCNNAIIRKDQIESGKDLTFNEVFLPIYIKIAKKIDPSHTLEVGAGTGHLAKELFNLGLQTTAIEPSTGMFNVANEVLQNTEVNLLNCNIKSLKNNNRYCLIISHLVAHVVPELHEFLRDIRPHLSDRGHFVFSIPHPCFYNEYKKIFDENYLYMSEAMKEISFQITMDSLRSISNVPYYHRPISEYINAVIKAGFKINSLNEVYPPQRIQKKYGELWKTPRYCFIDCSRI